MIRTDDNLSAPARAAFHCIIDVRSPAEFADDHLPGAINLPVLSNAERAEVGRIYVQESHFKARRLGAALVAANIAAHLQQSLCDRPADFRPLVYCWRGGMRSGAMATVFDRIGWQTTVLRGGYRSWRRQVAAALYSDAPVAQRLVLLDGATGSGKTAILQQLQAQGQQVLDLEELARHRGSLFGAMPGRQPPQKLFESRLFDLLQQQDASRPLFAEAESSRIGDITLPPALWAAMLAAPRIELQAGLDWRCRHIIAHYGGIAADPPALIDAIARLPSHHSKASRERWVDWARSGKVAPLVRELVHDHYDPAYARAQKQRRAEVLGVVPVQDDLAATADAVVRLVGG